MKARLIMVSAVLLGVIFLSACTPAKYNRGAYDFSKLTPGTYEVAVPYPAQLLVDSSHKAVLFVDLPSDAKNVHWAVLGDSGKNGIMAYTDTLTLSYMDNRGYHYQLTFPYLEIKVGDGLERFSVGDVGEIKWRFLK